jgi:hypothetical protein
MGSVRWRGENGGFPWNDMTTPLTLFVSPPLHKTLNLPPSVNMTVEYLVSLHRDKASQHILDDLGKERPHG